MRILVKAIYFIALFTLIKVVQSCILFGGCECSDEVHYYSISLFEVSNIDNSGLYPVATNENEMYASAVAFSITMADTSYSDYYTCSCSTKTGIGFNAAYAWSCDCSMNFLPIETIKSFRAYTLFDINDTIPAGTDVAEYFIAQEPYSYGSNLYIELDEILRQSNVDTKNEPNIRFNIFLSIPVEGPEAEFALEILFDNSEVLTVNTERISIIQPQN
ncbi:MAG: DUF5034 domain-containing protein [Bacteroidales bacterium]